MTTFQEARAFLLRHRTDYDAAVNGFKWPDPVPFNWALDWFDGGLATDPASKTRAALWIVDAAGGAETKVTFDAMSRALEPGREFSARAGSEARRSSAAAARQRRSAVGNHAGLHQAWRGDHPGDDIAHAR